MCQGAFVLHKVRTQPVPQHPMGPSSGLSPKNEGRRHRVMPVFMEKRLVMLSGFFFLFGATPLLTVRAWPRTRSWTLPRRQRPWIHQPNVPLVVLDVGVSVFSFARSRAFSRGAFLLRLLTCAFRGQDAPAFNPLLVSRLVVFNLCGSHTGQAAAAPILLTSSCFRSVSGCTCFWRAFSHWLVRIARQVFAVSTLFPSAAWVQLVYLSAPQSCVDVGC